MRKECTLEWVDDNGNVISNDITPIKAESSEETISKDEVLALINKAMYAIDNKDIQDYIFCGLRRDVHNLPSVYRPKGEWLDKDGNKVEIDDNGIPKDSCWCSVCDEWLVASDEYSTKGNFCPNCGADMRGDVM